MMENKIDKISKQMFGKRHKGDRKRQDIKSFDDLSPRQQGLLRISLIVRNRNKRKPLVILEKGKSVRGIDIPRILSPKEL